MKDTSATAPISCADASRELHEMLVLRYEPIAVTMIENDADVPETAIRPMRDFGKHMALCQAFTSTRRNNKSFYLDKKAQWCWNPLVGLGLVDASEGTDSFELISRVIGIPDPDEARAFFAKFPRLPLGKYEGILVEPLSTCSTKPDVVLIYANNAQLRSMVWGIKSMTGKLLSTELDAIDSCVYAIVPPMQTGDYRVTLPDPGELERAMAEDDEIILSVPGDRLSELITGLHVHYDRGMGYTQLERELPLDFKRPPFYNELYEMWGLDKGEDWDR